MDFIANYSGGTISKRETKIMNILKDKYEIPEEFCNKTGFSFNKIELVRVFLIEKNAKAKDIKLLDEYLLLRKERKE